MATRTYWYLLGQFGGFMGPTKLIFHFPDDASASMGVNGIVEESMGFPILWQTSHSLV